jgi:heat shock protein HslJ
MTRMSRLALAVVAVLLLPVLAACSSDGSADSAGAVDAAAAPTGGEGLTNAAWSLVGAPGVDPDPTNFGITLELAGSNVAGFSGVNRYMGTFTYGTEGTLDFGPLASTMMAGPQDAMDAEQAYLAALDTVTDYSVNGAELNLFQDDQLLLVYTKK